MFMGHLGVALGAKGISERISLLLLCVAATPPDLLDFSLEGLGHRAGAGLWSHSLAAMFAYALFFFGVWFAYSRKLLPSLLVGFVALSHMLLDLITSHLPLWPAGSPVGLHLYLHPRIDCLLECLVVLAGWYLYSRSLPALRRYSPASFGILATLLAMESLTLLVRFS